MKRAFILDAALGILVGLLLGRGLGSRLDALADFAREGPRLVLGRLLMFTALFGGVAGWVLAVLAEHITSMTGPGRWMPAASGLLAAGTCAAAAGLYFAGMDPDGGVLALFVGVFLVGGLVGVALRGGD